MAKKTVLEIDFGNPSAIEAAAKTLEGYAEDFENKVNTYIQRLVELGAETAQDAYGSAVTVTAEKTGEDEWAIMADGEAVVFLEFGAGSMVNSTNRYANKMGFPVTRGSFSDSKDPPGPYAQNHYEFWYFGGKKMYFVRPRNAMQKAYEAIATRCGEIAREVFG